eukprot:10270867-Alexandrium_andersonii.AAC.1
MARAGSIALAQGSCAPPLTARFISCRLTHCRTSNAGGAAGGGGAAAGVGGCGAGAGARPALIRGRVCK